MRYAVFGPDNVFRRMVEGASLALAADETALADPPAGLDASWRLVNGEARGLDAPIVLPDISDRQFARGLWGDNLISYADFLGFIGPGTIPPALLSIIDTLPDDDTGRPTPRKEAIGFLTGSKTYEFAHPLVDVFRHAIGWTPEFLRDRWMTWSRT